MPSRTILALLVACVVALDVWAEDKAAWAFRTPRRPALPTVRDARWIANPIDAFVLARLEEQGLAPSRRADKLTLLRRATFDLTGLPPTVAEKLKVLKDFKVDLQQQLETHSSLPGQQKLSDQEADVIDLVGMLFDLLFFALAAMLIFSTGIILYSSLFSAAESGFLLASPARADQIFAYKYQGAIAFSSWAFLLLGAPIFVAYGIAAAAPNLAVQHQAETAHLSLCTAEEYRSIRVPTLLVKGVLDDRTDLSLARELTALIPGARLELIEGSIHAPYFERPEIFNRLHLDFLDAHLGMP